MDSQEKGEFNIRQRQESLARRVGQALDQLKPNEARDCPDAEIIAAYAEQALATAETARWEGHFASCARCRNVLRVLAASSEAPLAEKEVSHLGELIAAARAPVAMDRKAAGTARPVRAGWRTRWLAPAVGVAAVLVVWLAMRPPWRATNQRSAQVLLAQAPKEELPQSPAPQEAQPSRESLSQDQKTEPAPPAKKESGVPPQQQKSLSTAQLQNIPAVPPSGPRDKDADKRIAPQARATVQPVVPLPAPSFAATSGSSTTNGVAPAPAPSPVVPSSTAQSVIVTEAAPTIETTNGALSSSTQPEAPASLPLNGRNFQSLSKVGGALGNAVLLRASGGSVVWRAGKGGTIERSSDAGKTWVLQMSPSQQDWLAGAPLSGTVCWLAGRKGAIARTLDGEHWDLIPPPARAATAGGVQPDWIGISALDAHGATVTSADGKRFTTSDGGMTWQAQ